MPCYRLFRISAYEHTWGQAGGAQASLIMLLRITINELRQMIHSDLFLWLQRQPQEFRIVILVDFGLWSRVRILIVVFEDKTVNRLRRFGSGLC